MSTKATGLPAASAPVTNTVSTNTPTARLATSPRQVTPPLPVPDVCTSLVQPAIVRRDDGTEYDAWLEQLPKSSGIEMPTRQDLAKMDRKRPKKGSNKDWKHPHDPEARITKMKDGRTRLAHKLEVGVDMETGAVAGVTAQTMDGGDCVSLGDAGRDGASAGGCGSGAEGSGGRQGLPLERACERGGVAARRFPAPSHREPVLTERRRLGSSRGREGASAPVGPRPWRASDRGARPSLNRNHRGLWRPTGIHLNFGPSDLSKEVGPPQKLLRATGD